jgi:GMP synthase (glutamine-hydrolysing)
MKDIHSQKILILDFGSQYTQLIARRVRELGVYSEIYPWDMKEEALRAFSPQGIILSGGPESVTEAQTPRAPSFIFDMNIPVLGICYGMQTMALQLGGKVEASSKKEFGAANIDIKEKSILFDSCEKVLPVWMSHGDKVTVLPQGFVTLAASENTLIAAMAHEEKRLYGVQFHPEVTHTPAGKTLLSHFLFKICHCEKNWTTDNIIETIVETIRQKAGKDKVILALSGGVDSSVLSALLYKAIGEQLICVFVDTGLLRANESEQVMHMLGKQLSVPIHRVEASDLFFKALKGATDPEVKRKIIGKAFIDVFTETSQSFKGIKWLAQGTIYPDVIESAGNAQSSAKVIKSHHNVGGLPEKLDFHLLEPLRELFKDEVRQIGLTLGLPSDMIFRHPFPGPGLAVRVLEEVTLEYVEIVRHADAIFIEELRRAHLYEKVSQAFAVFLPVKSVGVAGDGRRYEYVIALRAVETIDFMTAQSAALSLDFLSKVSARILNEVSRVSRVVYDISDKPPATIEWE